jgi:hypothetical protein
LVSPNKEKLAKFVFEKEDSVTIMWGRQELGRRSLHRDRLFALLVATMDNNDDKVLLE